MKFQSKWLSFMTIIGLFLTFPALANVTPGSTAPAISAVDTRGNKVSLEDYFGKVVVLEWTNHDCPFVQKHYDAGNMQALQQQATRDGVVWITLISSAKGKQGYVMDDAANAIALSKNASPNHIIRDVSGDIGQRYGAKTTPHMYVINSEGKLTYSGAIDSIKSANPADIADATNYVTAALVALQKGELPEITQTQAYGCSIKY